MSVLDSGLNFADGVFDGIRVYGGRVFRLDQHLDRLLASAEAFAIDVGLTKAELTAEILRWLAAAGVEDAFHFRPIVTRGRRFPPRLDPRFCTGPATVVFVGGPVSGPPTGIRAVVSSIRRPAPDVLAPHVKSLNYGPSLLARLEALRRGADDALLLDERGTVAEATAANVFLVLDGRLVTPRPRACLPGITRAAILELAPGLGLEVEEAELDASALFEASELFLCGTGIEVQPVVELEGRAVGSGDVGPVTAAVAGAYGALVRSEGTPIPAA